MFNDCNFVYSCGDGNYSKRLEKKENLSNICGSGIMNSQSESEKNYMSFVIMAANNNGMACAADSRSTLGNDWFPQVENDETTKAFKNDYMLIATYGPNKVNEIDNKIEDVINQILPNCTTPFEFSEEFRKRVYDNKKYEFLIGWENNVYEFHVSKGYVEYYFKGKDFFSINSKFLSSKLSIDFNLLDTVDVLEDKCRKAVEQVIEFCTKAPYSYVGGPIKSYSLEYKKK